MSWRLITLSMIPVNCLKLHRSSRTIQCSANRSRCCRYTSINGLERIFRTKYDASLISDYMGIFLSVQQDPEVCLAAYRALSALVLRPWCFVQICSREEIIDTVTDPGSETTKIGMEVRHNCCQAIYKALTSSVKLANDPSLDGITAKLQEAVRRGPYLVRKHPEAQPAIMRAKRF